MEHLRAVSELRMAELFELAFVNQTIPDVVLRQGALMAPLYKRYIPPKTSAIPAPVQEKPVQKVAPVVIPDEPPKKRKRERTEEEIAERKAKKLRKKGIDPTTVIDIRSKEQNDQASVEADNGISTQLPLTSDKTAEGEFAHIKNTKKRHKLEKEARKARKASNIASQGEDSGRDDPAEATGNVLVHRAALAPDDDPNAIGVRTTKDKSKRKKGEKNVSSATTEPRTEGLGKPSLGTVISRGDLERQDHDVGHIQDEGVEHTTHDRVERNGASIQPKKRRHKLESILKQPQQQVPEVGADDDDHLRKHEGVMHKFQKSKALSQAAPKPAEVQERSTTEPVLLDLAPLPQPDKVPTPEFVPDPYALPEWLAKPTLISNDNKKSFNELGLEPKLVEHLSKLGFKESMPVQAALIPLLLPPGMLGARFLPGTESVLPDVAVGAPTGSGKTIAYLLPLIESLKKTAGLGRVKALVIVPTRELVVQVAAVADSLARGTSLKIGMATGTGNFKDEQNKLVKLGRQYDPNGYQRLMTKAHRQDYPPPTDSEEFADYLNEIESQDARDLKRVEDVVSCLVDHVPTYESSVDILVATPGRLLEHLDVTLGFNLAHLEWLVLDEADKLIDQQYHGFLSTLNEELGKPRTLEEQDAREQYLRSKGCWNEQRERRVRRVLLSATMTRDVSKLVDLRLKRPQLVVVRGREDGSDSVATPPDENGDVEIGAARELKDGFELPPSLREYCVHVGDGSEKSLYLTELLSKYILSTSRAVNADEQGYRHDDGSNASGVSDSEFSASDSTSSIDDDSNGDSSSEHEQVEEETFEREQDDHVGLLHNGVDIERAMHPDRTAMLGRLAFRHASAAELPTVLVFTSSTESANRLSHLLKKLQPDIEFAIHTMTAADQKKNHLSRVKATDLAIVISTDRAARGLDSIANRPITHVLQYDVPRSATGYVHRVGRTARAGRPGEAWTLYTHSEARWFLNEVAKAKSIKRAESVEKVKLQAPDEASQEELKEAIAELRNDVYRSSRVST